MAEDDIRRVAESLDPAKYIEHVTRTALLLERLADDVSALRTKGEDGSRTIETLRSDVAGIKQDLAVFKVKVDSEIKANQEAIRDLSEGLRWLRRLVVGAVVTGLLSGALAIVFKLVVR